MKIEAGKYYRNRAGDVVGPMESDDETLYPFQCNGLSFTENGVFYIGSTNGDDLIEEVPSPHVEAGPEYGPEIQVDGKRPAWLGDDDFPSVEWIDPPKWLGTPENPCSWYQSAIMMEKNWPCVRSIRLPASHWAYQAIEQGFEPWAGGEKAPDDWYGCNALRRNGKIFSTTADARGWVNNGHPFDIIGYLKKDATMREKLEEAEKGGLFDDGVDPRDAEIATLKAELSAARAKHPDLVPDPDRGLKDEITVFIEGCG